MIDGTLPGDLQAGLSMSSKSTLSSLATVDQECERACPCVDATGDFELEITVSHKPLLKG